MTEDSRTLEQRIEAAQAAFNGGMRKSLERAGLPDLLAERDALLERAEHAESERSGWAAAAVEAEARCAVANEDAEKRLAERDAARAAAREMAKVLEQVAAGEVGGRMRARLVLADFPGFLEEGS